MVTFVGRRARPLDRSVRAVHPPVDADPDREMRLWLREVSVKRSRWGYRGAYAGEDTAMHACNLKKVHRLWRQEGLQVHPKRRKRRRPGKTSIPAERCTALRLDHV